MGHLHFLIQLKEHSSDLVLHLHKAEILARDTFLEKRTFKIEAAEAEESRLLVCCIQKYWTLPEFVLQAQPETTKVRSLE